MTLIAFPLAYTSTSPLGHAVHTTTGSTDADSGKHTPESAGTYACREVCGCMLYCTYVYTAIFYFAGIQCPSVGEQDTSCTQEEKD